jgi:hypothetical protein
VNGIIVVLKTTIVLLVIGIGWGFINWPITSDDSAPTT